MKHVYSAVSAVTLLCVSGLAFAHDTWVQTNTPLIRTGDAVYVDLCLGNHGNDHRDFKLASKADVASSTLEVIAPDGTRYDLKDRLVDVGYAPKEGFWQSKFAAATPGLYIVGHTQDRLINHGRPARTVKGAKTLFVVSDSLDRPETAGHAFDRVVGHALELVPLAHPVMPMGPGMPIKVRLLFQGEPLANARVSFIPRGETLAEGFDETYERRTNAAGEAEFTPKSGDQYLVIVHHRVAEAGEGYEEINYSAALTVLVPEVCPCCE